MSDKSCAKRIMLRSSTHQQVILSVYLDHATEKVLNVLGLPIHSKEALSACEYYSIFIEDLHKKQSSHASSKNTGLSPSLSTPAQLAKVAAGVNPLCSMSPKASLMADALVHETFIVLCEGIIQRSADAFRILISGQCKLLGHSHTWAR